MSSQEPPSKKQRTLKPSEEWKETPPLEELEEKPRSPLMEADEVGSTLEVMENLGDLPSLPFANKYHLGPKYYIRECYDEYYTLVNNMLGNEEECVTVTGTPGIGKSIFYAYFFQRLQKEKKGKNTWIIAAAYHKDKLKLSFGYKDNCDDVEKFRSVEKITDFVSAALEEKKSVILLSDGPPERLWGETQMVVFTSPNDSWLRSVRKDNCTLYMPLWTLTELQEAAEMLALQGRDGSCITDEVIEKRFYTFGGKREEIIQSLQNIPEGAALVEWISRFGCRTMLQTTTAAATK
eukprot:jgi/Phyca11/505742/fgenesh2_kg.PHYCAscaffold_15_\